MFEDESSVWLVSSDFSILMKTESLWGWDHRKLIDILKVILYWSWFDGLVSSTVGVSEANVDSSLLDESLKNTIDESDIFIISYSSSVVNFGSKEVKYLEWNNIESI